MSTPGKLRALLAKFRPAFWDQRAEEGPYKSLFNYQRTWRLSVGLLAAVALAPLCIMTAIDYNVSKRAISSENKLTMGRLTSNTRRSVAYFLDERRAALDFIVREETFAGLTRQDRLEDALKNLKSGFGGFLDLGLIDASGRQIAYVGPYSLLGRDYSGQDWFKNTLAQGHYISDVFLGFRNVPHMIIAIKKDLPDGSFYVLRTTLDTKPINDLLKSLDLSGIGDAFIINKDGALQTYSRYHGGLLEKVSLPVPEYSARTEVLEMKNKDGEGIFVGYAYIQGSPLILIVVKNAAELMKPWYDIRLELVWFLAASILVILLVILGVATYMVNKIYVADQTRAMTLHQVEHTNKMASIGRLAAGVAHEINNPLAIINEKAGLLRDLIVYKGQCEEGGRLVGLIDSVLGSVERCGAITKRLLGFARHIEVSIQPVKIQDVIEEVLSFLTKEAEYRSIRVDVDMPAPVPVFESDRGKLQQIFLNLINNAFQAMNDGGRLGIRIVMQGENRVTVSVSDDGCGIPAADLKRIFDPFFSTKTKKGGTGLGLSITYGLVQELGGTLRVESALGKGTTFYVSFPLKQDQRTVRRENSSGG